MIKPFTVNAKIDNVVLSKFDSMALYYNERSIILLESTKNVRLPANLGGSIENLSPIKGFRKCTMCGNECAYRKLEKKINNKHIVVNHCFTNKTFYFTGENK